MRTKGLCVLVSVLFIAVLLVSGCSKPAPAPKTTPAPAPAPTAAPAPKPAPAPAPTSKPTATPAPTPTAKAYFEGQTIEFILGSSTGGSTDMWARMVALHLPKFIPGKPAIVVKNVPAGGGLSATNQVWHAKADGKTAMTGARVDYNVVRPKGTEFKLEEMYPVYAMSQTAVTFVKAGLVSKSEDIVNAKGLIFGYAAPTKNVSGMFILSKELLGFQTEKMIWGYGGGPSILAYLQGEINFCISPTVSYNASIKPSVDKGQTMALWQGGVLDAQGNVVRSNEVPDVPTMVEVYQRIHGKAPSGPAFEAYKMLVSMLTFDKVLFFPPRMPKNILDILMKAGVDMMKDPLYRSDIDKLSPGAIHIVGEELVKSWPSGVTAKGEIIDWYRKFLKDKYDANLEEVN